MKVFKVCGKCLLIGSLIISTVAPVCAQWDHNYQIKKVYTNESYELIQNIQIHGTQQILDLDKSEKHLEKHFESITEVLIGLVRSEKIIDDDSTQFFIQGVVTKIVENNEISTPIRILILRSAEVNAYNLGNGTLIVCNGLLSKFDNEEQLAFVLAHEMAHHELRHFERKISQNLNTAENYLASREIKNISKGKVSLGGIRKIRSWNYDKKRFSRKMELEADSLAFILFSNSYKECRNIITALHKLDSGITFLPELGGRIFGPLSFQQYRFKSDWIKRANVEYLDKTKFNTYSVDSSLTHPVVEQRIDKLETYTEKSMDTRREDTISTAYRKIKLEAEFENIQCAFVNGRSEYALYLALRMIYIYPNHSYLVEMITKILQYTAELKGNSMFDMSTLDITGYNQEQVFVSNFIINLRGSEAAELAR